MTVPGTYLNSFYERRPMPYAEPAYGYPEAGQTVVNVTNGKLIRLLVDDEPFDVRYGRLLEHGRVLDLRAGTLTRKTDWESPTGGRVRVRSRRLVSLTQRAVAAIEYVVEAVGQTLRLIVQSELVANEPTPPRSGDPREAAVSEDPLAALDQDLHDRGALLLLLHPTRRSGLQLAAGVPAASWCRCGPVRWRTPSGAPVLRHQEPIGRPDTAMWHMGGTGAGTRC
jgi:alpha,alpha-trehalose phosphorylase